LFRDGSQLGLYAFLGIFSLMVRAVFPQVALGPGIQPAFLYNNQLCLKVSRSLIQPAEQVACLLKKSLTDTHSLTSHQARMEHTRNFEL
jgi:hypothetical protein